MRFLLEKGEVKLVSLPGRCSSALGQRLLMLRLQDRRLVKNVLVLA